MIQWKEIYNMPERYELECITDDTQELNIVLAPTSQHRRRIYMCFRCADDYQVTARQFTPILHDITYGQQLRILKTTNSPFMQWMTEQGGGGLFNCLQDRIHYTIIMSDYIIDIIDYQDPEIHFFEG